MWLYSNSSKRSPKSNSSSSRHRSPTATTNPRPTSPGSALAEVLRKNPFRAGSKESLTRSEEVEDEDASVSLNRDLLILADFFPDVKVEVFRELLVRFDGDSRRAICTEQLYKYKAEWARGRLNVPPRGRDELLPAEELFRTKEYTDAVKWTVGREFGGLSRSAIDAVLAEVNFSYTTARPTLQVLASKSWKVALTNIFKKKRGQDDAPSMLLDKATTDTERPRLVSTGSHELDQELSELFAHPFSSQRPKDHQATDHELAQALNLKEAQEAGALFECKVCYNDITFEDVSACTHSNHVICLDCVRRTLHEAIFGQGWAKSIDLEHGTLKCLSPDTCDGHVPQELIKRALLLDKSGAETWTRFEDRLAEFNLQQSCISLVRCPFCSYAEASQAYDPSAGASFTWHIRKPTGTNTLFFIILCELLPTILFFLLPFLMFFPSYSFRVFYTSLAHLALRQRTTRFTCRRPSCSRKSCLKCFKPWHDPHVCHEPLILSLRTTVEAARTAAVKRTCPRCGTSFVKSSGCNKLTCVCGYSMCYICRKNIGKAGSSAEGGEGYRHFCEHFRPVPGQKCQECDKCDLYRAEDEDAQVRRAGEEAERLWREREGLNAVDGASLLGLEEALGNLNVGGEDKLWRKVWEGRWSVQAAVDRVVEWCIVVEID